MGPYKCPECGVWWAGLEHSCRLPLWSDGTGNDHIHDRFEPYVDADGQWVIRPYVGPVWEGTTTSAPWCAICGGFHIPGAGPCTATYSVAQ